MKTRLTLRIEGDLVIKAKREAHRRGKSVSRMVAEYFAALGEEVGSRDNLPPVTGSLYGLLRGKSISERDYRKHLREKYF